MNLKRLPRRYCSAAQSQFPPPVAGAEEAGDDGEEAAAGLAVGIPSRFALAREAGDHQGLRAAVLLNARLTVPEADPRLLPATHRHVGSEVVDQHVVDVDGAALDPAGDLLGPHLLSEDRAGEPVAGVVGE